MIKKANVKSQLYTLCLPLACVKTNFSLENWQKRKIIHEILYTIDHGRRDGGCV